MKDKIIDTLIQHYESKIAEHKLNVDIMIANPRAIPEHESFIEAVDKEIALIAESKDKLDVLKQFF